MPLASRPPIDMIRDLLGGEHMPKKYQSGRLEVRRDVKRPYYFVRASIKRPDANGVWKTSRPPHKLGFLDEITLKEAKQLRAEVLEGINAGRFVAQSQMPFRILAKKFTETRLPLLGVATQAQYKCQIENHLVPAFGKMKVGEIDRPAVEQFLTAKAETLGWWSRNNLRSILSAIFKAAKDWKLWEGENPTLGVRIGKKRFAREKRLLTAEQMRRLLANLPDRLRFIVHLQFGLGLRISETLGLKWRDFDFEKASVTIRRRWYRGDLSEEDQTKTEASNAEVRICAALMAEVQRHYPGPHKREEFVFLGDDGRNPPDDRDLLRFEFRPIVTKLELYYPGFGWHAFRRQNITWRQQIGGATLPEAQKAARHASLDMTYLYSLNDSERETAQQQAMFDYLVGVPEGEKPQ